MAPKGGTSGSTNPVFTALAAKRRREMLRLLLNQDGPVTVQTVTAHLEATDPGPTPDSPAPDRQTNQTELRHIHVPLLEDVGLITWNRDGATIDMAPHRSLDDPRFRLLLDAEADGLDEALMHLASERRRVLLTTLREARSSITRADLARELLRSDETTLEQDRNAVDTVIASLHHVDLPALDDVDLLQYDGTTGRATATDHPGLEEVFTIIYEPEDRLVDACDGFFEGLGAAYDKLTSETSTEDEWPHSWGDSSHG